MSPTLADGRCRLHWGACLVLVAAAHAAAALLVLQRAPGSLPRSADAAPLVLDLLPAPSGPAREPSAGPPQQAPAAPPPPELAPSLAAPPVTAPVPVAPAEPKPRPAQPKPPPARAQPQRHAPSPRSEARAASAVPPTPGPAQSPVPSAAAAPATGPSQPAASAGSALHGWQGELLGRLQRAKRYPGAARQRDEQGIATVTFTMDRTGHVLSASLVRSSGSAALDEEAVALVHRAEPLPAMPSDIAGESIKLTVPIAFSLR